MTRYFKSAGGRQIDFDSIRLLNEQTIAVGNMKVNARGDELGHGGKIVKTRDQIMKEYYALNSPTAVEELREQVQQQQAENNIPAVSGKAAAEPTPFIAPPVPVARVAPVPPVLTANNQWNGGPNRNSPPASPIVADVNSGLDDNDMGEPVEVPIVPAQVATPMIPVVPTVGIPAPVAPIVNAAAQTTEKMPAPDDVHSNPATMRGSLAGAVAAGTTVNQTERLLPKKANGIQRF